MRERVPMTDFARQWAEHVAASASPRMLSLIHISEPTRH